MVNSDYPYTDDEPPDLLDPMPAGFEPYDPENDNVSSDSGEPILSFGKHRNTAISEVPMDYQVWLLDRLTQDKESNKLRNDAVPLLEWLRNNLSQSDIDCVNSILVNGVAIIPFGKHKGSPIKSLPEDYLIWLLNSLKASRDAGTIRPAALEVLKWIEDNIKAADPEPEPVTDDTVMWFGKHDGVPLKEIDEEYLLWLHGRLVAQFKRDNLYGRRLKLYEWIDTKIGSPGAIYDGL